MLDNSSLRLTSITLYVYSVQATFGQKALINGRHSPRSTQPSRIQCRHEEDKLHRNVLTRQGWSTLFRAVRACLSPLQTHHRNTEVAISSEITAEVHQSRISIRYESCPGCHPGKTAPWRPQAPKRTPREWSHQTHVLHQAWANGTKRSRDGTS